MYLLSFSKEKRIYIALIFKKERSFTTVNIESIVFARTFVRVYINRQKFQNLIFDFDIYCKSCPNYFLKIYSMYSYDFPTILLFVQIEINHFNKLEIIKPKMYQTINSKQQYNHTGKTISKKSNPKYGPYCEISKK